MLALDDPRWSELAHAYGPASDVPPLLRTLAASPRQLTGFQAEPWFSIWSCLCHQGDIYTASYAAVPHVVDIAMRTEGPIDFSFFQLPAHIEVARMEGRGLEIPADLKGAYCAAVAGLMDAVARHRNEDWDEATLLSAIAAQAASKGHRAAARALADLDAEMIARINDQDPAIW